MKMTTTVAMATYQGEEFIEKQLESIFQQTIKVDEIIIYDDASNDHTIEIVEKFQLRNEIKIKVYTQEQQQGYVRNFACALEMTSGDIIFLCDQDDIWDKDKVEKILTLFIEHEEAKCINTSFEYIDEFDKEIIQNNQNDNYGMCFRPTEINCTQIISFEEITLHNISMGCTMAFRSTIKDEYLKRSSKKAAHDWELNLISALQNGLMFYNVPLMKYRIHKNNTTGNDKIGKQKHVYATEREKNANELYQYGTSLQHYEDCLSKPQISWCKELALFHQNRYKMLHEGKPLIWFKLLLKRQIYKRIVSSKGIVVDFLYSVHK